MASELALLMIADIGGYTDYMLTHRMSLAHAEVNTGRLLEAVIDAAPKFELIEIEGDAAFLSRNADTLDPGGPVAAVTQAAAGMHRAFHIELRNVVSNLCPCDVCSQADKLKLKFVAHIGEVASRGSGTGGSSSGSTSSTSTGCSRTPSTRPSTCSSPRSSTGRARARCPRCGRFRRSSRASGPPARSSSRSRTSPARCRRRRTPPGRRASGGRSTWPAAASRTCLACAAGAAARRSDQPAGWRAVLELLLRDELVVDQLKLVVARRHGAGVAGVLGTAPSMGRRASARCCCRNRLRRMEPLWSPVVATRGNRSQIRRPPKPQKQAKSLAVGCDGLPPGAHGKEGVDGSSPSEGSTKAPHVGAFPFRSSCSASNVR